MEEEEKGGHTASFLRLLHGSCFLSDDGENEELNVNAQPHCCNVAAAEDKRIFLMGDGEFFLFFFSERAAQECVEPSSRSS